MFIQLYTLKERESEGFTPLHAVIIQSNNLKYVTNVQSSTSVKLLSLSGEPIKRKAYVKPAPE